MQGTFIEFAASSLDVRVHLVVAQKSLWLAITLILNN